METDIKYLIQKGKTYFKNKAYSKAESILLRIVSEKREFADVFNMLGVIYHQTGQFNRAISHFEKALKINPRYTEAMVNLSVLYNDLGNYKLSKKLVERSKQGLKADKEKIDPFIKGKLANKHAEVGDIYRGVGLFEKACNEYEKALELAPNFYDIRNRLGVCLREAGKKQEALTQFTRIVKENNKYVEAQIQLGITLYSLDRKQEARKVWQQLAKDYPQHNLVRMYLKLSEQPTNDATKKLSTKEEKLKKVKNSGQKASASKKKQPTKKASSKKTTSAQKPNKKAKAKKK